MDVVFVVMPFADVGRPAIGVSLLKAAAARAGYTSTVIYPNVRLAAEVGVGLYQKLSSSFPPEALAGEWFFADDLFSGDIPDEDVYLDEILAKYATGETIAAVRAARRRRDAFLDAVAADIIALSPRVVGFTTTFHQTCGSVAVARRLKALPEPPVVVFGGANCEGEMGVQLLDSFPCI